MSISSIGAFTRTDPQPRTGPGGRSGGSGEFSGFLTDAATASTPHPAQTLGSKVLQNGMAGLIQKLEDERREKELRELALANLGISEAELEKMSPEARAAAEKKIAEEMDRLRIELEKEEEEQKKTRARAAAPDPTLIAEKTKGDL